MLRNPLLAAALALGAAAAAPAQETTAIAACDAHFRSETPPPNPAEWVDIADPGARLRAALMTFYRFYRRGEKMIANAQRELSPIDADIDPLESASSTQCVAGVGGELDSGEIKSA